MTRPTLDRNQFPVSDTLCYLNHAGMAPLPLAASDAIALAARQWVESGGRAFDHQVERAEQVRAAGAALMGVPVTDVAFVKNTTEGLGFVASGLTWRPGDRVVVPDLDFPSTVYPWLALRDRGVQVDLLAPVGEAGALPLERFEEALRSAPTRLVACSWVQFGRGWRTDLAGLATLCHEHGALLCVDAIQGLGVLPARFDEWGVDFATADAHKWLLGPLGIGVLYVAERCRDLLTPLEPGWASVTHREEWDNLDLVYDDSARRFEGGSANLLGLIGMGASIDLLQAAGVERTWAHVDALCDRAVGGLTEAGATVWSDRVEGRSANVTFGLPGVDIDRAWESLDAQGFVCSPRGGGVRIAPHGYNTVDEIDRFVAAIAALTRR